MEVKKITKIETCFKHEVVIEFSNNTFTYTVNTAHLPNGRCWVQSYGRNYGVGQLGTRLTTSERKKVKNYFETEFIKIVSSIN
jgi:hypothetical protein